MAPIWLLPTASGLIMDKVCSTAIRHSVIPVNRGPNPHIPKTRGLYAGFGEFYTSIVILWQALPPVSAGFRQCLNTAHHCLQTVAAGGAQVVEQVEFGKVTLDI